MTQPKLINKSTLPFILYGTAWKEEATENLVYTALKMGFRGIDTANQRRHYYEEAVGRGIAKSGISREELFIQTKFTYARGHDHRLPYDLNVNYRIQVRQSFESSLIHLQITYIDSYVLHGPSVGVGLSTDDWDVWTEMEALYREGRIKYLGVSNISFEQLQILFQRATIKPSFVQNRCFAQVGWDKKVREYCKQNHMIYQGFSLLTANLFVLPLVKNIAQRVNKTPAQVVFRFAKSVGILPLTGTTNIQHMNEDLNLDFSLTTEEIEFLENIAVS